MPKWRNFAKSGHTGLKNKFPPFQLRYLQTLSSIAAEHNSTIIFPMPMNILDHFMDKGSSSKKSKPAPVVTVPAAAVTTEVVET